MREAGATAVQEVAFTLANAIAYVDAAVAAGLAFEEFAPRLSFFFAAHNDLFEEVAKFRVARRVWARVAARPVRRHQPREPGDALPRADRRLDADRPAAGHERGPHDGAGPGGRAGRRAEPAHQRPGRGSWPADPRQPPAWRCERNKCWLTSPASPAPVDPLGGSYYVESLTDALEELVTAELAEMERRGGTIAALADGYQQGEIAQAAYEFQRAIKARKAIVVGVNAFAEGGDEQRPAPQQIDPEAEARQVARTQAVRAARDQGAAEAAVAGLTGRPPGHGERAAAHPGLRGSGRHAGRDQRRAAGRVG